jgi:cytoskeletal protein CcmA (bactofilin family)
MSFFGKPSGAEPRITYERIDLSAETAAEPEAEAARAPASARLLAERLEPRSERARGAEASMLLAADSELEGRLNSRGTVRIEGVLRGALEAPQLLLEAGGLLDGHVTVDRLRVSGTLRGTVIAREIEVLRSARIDAELIYEEISIERGARVTGLHRQREIPPQESTAPATSATPLVEPVPPVAALPAAATAPAAIKALSEDSASTLLPSQDGAALPPVPAIPASPLPDLAVVSVIAALPVDPAAEERLLNAAANTAALVAEAEAALQELAQITHAAAGAATELAREGVAELVELETVLRATPQDLVLHAPAA